MEGGRPGGAGPKRDPARHAPPCARVSRKRGTGDLRPQPDRGEDALRSAAFGERIAARDPDRQTAEVPIRVAPMNRFNELGTAEITRIA